MCSILSIDYIKLNLKMYFSCFVIDGEVGRQGSGACAGGTGRQHSIIQGMELNQGKCLLK